MSRSLAFRSIFAPCLAAMALLVGASSASASFGFLDGMNLNGGGASGDLLQFSGPTAVARASDGSFFVTDVNNSRIVKLNPDGSFNLSWGFLGTGDGRFLYPSDIDIAPDGTVFVADTGNNRVQWFTQSGGFIGKLGGPGTGSALGQFNSASAVAVAPDGSVYAADSQNKRIQHFTLTGGVANTPTAFGSAGSGDGQLNGPSGVDVDPTDGSVFVVDRFNSRVQKFSSTGTFLTKFGGANSQPYGMSAPRDVVVNTGVTPHEVLVSNDYFDHRIQRFTTDGTFVSKWGDDANDDGDPECEIGFSHLCAAAGMFVEGSTLWVADTGNDRIVSFVGIDDIVPPIDTPVATTAYGGDGSGEGQMIQPQAVAVAPDRSAYVTDYGNNRIQHWSAKGELLDTFGSTGSGNGEFLRIGAIAVAPNGHVFVLDYANTAYDEDTSRLQEFDENGQFVALIAGTGTPAGPLNYAAGLAIDGNGNIFVSNGGEYEIVKFDSTGTELTSWGVVGADTTDFDFQYPYGVAVDESGDNVYVADQTANRVKHFTGTGGYLGKTNDYDGPGGAAAERYKNPTGIAVDNDSGDVLIADTGNNRIKRIDALLGNPTNFGQIGTDLAEFQAPNGVAADANGYVWVADTNNNRVQRFGKEPDVQITSPTDNELLPGGSGTLEYTVSDAGADCDTANNSAFGPFAPGAHTITVSCTNPRGADSASVTVNVPVALPPQPPGGGGGGGITPADPILPQLVLPKKLKLAIKLTFRANCPSGCTVAGKLKIGKKSYKLKSVSLPANAGAQRVTLKVPKSVVKKGLAALKSKKKITLTVVPTLPAAYGAKAGKTGKASIAK